MSTLNVKQRGLVLLVLVMMLAGCSFGGTALTKEAEPEAKAEVVIESDTALVEEARSETITLAATPSPAVESAGSAMLPTVIMMEGETKAAAPSESAASAVTVPQ